MLTLFLLQCCCLNTMVCVNVLCQKILSKHLLYSFYIRFTCLLIRVYPCKWWWPDLPHSNSSLSNSHSPCHSIHGILLLQTNTLALLLHLRLSCLPLSSSLPPALYKTILEKAVFQCSEQKVGRTGSIEMVATFLGQRLFTVQYIVVIVVAF